MPPKKSATKRASRATGATSKGFIVFDTETSGLTLHPAAPLSKQPHIIEFGATMLSTVDGSIVDSIEILINPGIPITAEITGITGISPDMLVGQPTFAEAWPRIRDFFDRSGAALAHNEPFDAAMLGFELKRAGIKDWTRPKAMCTVGLYRPEFGYDPKLTQVYNLVMGRPLDQKHRAASDVAALVEIVQAAGIWRLA